MEYKEYVLSFDNFVNEGKSSVFQIGEEKEIEKKKDDDDDDDGDGDDDDTSKEDKIVKEYYFNSFMEVSDAILESDDDDEFLFESEGNNYALLEDLNETIEDIDDMLLEADDGFLNKLKEKAKALKDKLGGASGRAKEKLKALYYGAMFFVYKYMAKIAKKAGKREAAAKYIGKARAMTQNKIKAKEAAKKKLNK